MILRAAKNFFQRGSFAAHANADAVSTEIISLSVLAATKEEEQAEELEQTKLEYTIFLGGKTCCAFDCTPPLSWVRHPEHPRTHLSPHLEGLRTFRGSVGFRTCLRAISRGDPPAKSRTGRHMLRLGRARVDWSLDPPGPG